MTQPNAPPVFTEDDWTADLPKAGAWDLWRPDLTTDPPSRKLIDTLDELNVFLKAYGSTIAEFLKLPAAYAMPAGIRKELTAKGYDVPVFSDQP